MPSVGQGMSVLPATLPGSKGWCLRKSHRVPGTWVLGGSARSTGVRLRLASLSCPISRARSTGAGWGPPDKTCLQATGGFI